MLKATASANKQLSFVFYLLTAVAISALLLTGCAGSRTSESTGEYIDDSVITAKVKTAIADRLGVETVAEVSVETFKGVVQLSGFIDSAQGKADAGSEAATVRGVRRVENKISVK